MLSVKSEYGNISDDKYIVIINPCSTEEPFGNHEFLKHFEKLKKLDANHKKIYNEENPFPSYDKILGKCVVIQINNNKYMINFYIQAFKDPPYDPWVDGLLNPVSEQRENDTIETRLLNCLNSFRFLNYEMNKNAKLKELICRHGLVIPYKIGCSTDEDWLRFKLLIANFAIKTKIKITILVIETQSVLIKFD
jgi:hypothetical protein